MATLTPQSRLLNLEKSINAYLSVFLTGVDIKYMRQPLGVAGDEWVELNQFRLLSPQVLTRTEDGIGSQDGQWQVDVNCFRRNTHVLTNIFTLPALAQQVEELFAVHAPIPINDYDTAGNPQVGTFRTISVNPFNVPVNPEMRVDQITVSATLGYLYASNSV